jgi:hypothetical protein
MPKRKYYDTKKHLATRCKRLKLRLPMSMRRDDMLSAMHTRAVHIIVVAIRRHLLNKAQLKNDVDPISMDVVPAAQRWLVRERDCVYQFDARLMIDYLLSEGIFQNPLTRMNFSDEALEDLDRLCRKLDLIGAGCVHLVDQRRTLARERAEARERLRTLEFLDDECVRHLFAVVTLCARHTTTASMVHLGMGVFFRTLAVLEDSDIERAEQCLVYCIDVVATAFDRSASMTCADMRHAIYCLLTRRLRAVHGSFVHPAHGMHIALYTRMLMFVADPNVPNTPFPAFEIM